MGALSQLRIDVADVLEPVLPGRVYPAPPDTLVAPAIWVRRAAVVADGRSFRALRVEVEVVIVVDGATHAGPDLLDDLTEQAWVLLAKNGHVPVQSNPTTLDTGTQMSYLAERMTVHSLTDCSP